MTSSHNPVDLYVWAIWKGKPAAWYKKIKGTLFQGDGYAVHRTQLTVLQEYYAESLEDAKVKQSVGAGMFSFVSKGKALGEQETVGDVNATRRTVDEIVGQLSDEAVRFLLTTAGIQPGIAASIRRTQLCSRILH